MGKITILAVSGTYTLLTGPEPAKLKNKTETHHKKHNNHDEPSYCYPPLMALVFLSLYTPAVARAMEDGHDGYSPDIVRRYVVSVALPASETHYRLHYSQSLLLYKTRVV